MNEIYMSPKMHQDMLKLEELNRDENMKTEFYVLLRIVLKGMRHRNDAGRAAYEWKSRRRVML